MGLITKEEMLNMFVEATDEHTEECHEYIRKTIFPMVKKSYY